MQQLDLLVKTLDEEAHVRQREHVHVAQRLIDHRVEKTIARVPMDRIHVVVSPRTALGGVW